MGGKEVRGPCIRPCLSPWADQFPLCCIFLLRVGFFSNNDARYSQQVALSTGKTCK